MMITAKNLRKAVKDACPSLKSMICDYVECRDPRYWVPAHDDMVAVIDICWAPIATLRQASDIGDCDNASLCLMAAVLEWRWRSWVAGNIDPAEKAQWPIGDAAGRDHRNRPHAFNIFMTDRGVWICDRGDILLPNGYQPLTARF